MITVESLHVYPVKSCRGIDLTVAEVVETGFRYDRQWMVVDTDGVFLSQRGHPELACVSTSIESQRLVLDAPGLGSLTIALDRPAGEHRRARVWKDTCEATDEGTEAADWFSTLLGTPCELIRLPEESIRQVNRKYAEEGDRVAFADGFPFLLVGRASVEDLNRRLEEPVTTDRFRANIVVTGCEPWAEDDWTGITIGEVDFRAAKPCARCVVITTDQESGARTAEPLRTLAGFRTVGGKVLFGQNLVHRGTGRVHVGDRVRVSPS